MIRLLPEWTEVESVLLAWPARHTDWDYILQGAQEQYVGLITSMNEEKIHVVLICHDPEEPGSALAGCDMQYITFVSVPYNDTWTRDYGPITVVKDERLRALDFGFNGWGLKFASDKDNLVNLNLMKKSVIPRDIYRNEKDYVLEGGSIETDGAGTLLTTTRCLCSENRNGGLSKKDVEEILRRRLGVDHVLMLDHGALEGDDTDSHIDTLARLAPDNCILFTGCRNVDDPQFEELLKMRAQLSMMRNAEGNPFNLIELPLPDPIHDDDGNRLPATYANYLVVNDVIFMPSYGQPANDYLACQTVKIAFPGCKVKSVDCQTLIKQHGSLHCATMQIPKGLLQPVVYDA